MEQSVIRQYRKKYWGELMDNCLGFWLEYAPDPLNGGIYNSLTREGTVYCQDKSVWLHGRCVWTFSHLCNLYGYREDWHRMAQNCLTFLERHCIDTIDGRMYFLVTADGRPIRKRRYYFSETFYIIGCAEYSLAFDDPHALEQAKKYFRFVMDIYHDPNCDPYKITPKHCVENRQTQAFANSMILLNTAHILQRCDPKNSDEYVAVAAELTDHILSNFYKEDLRALLEIVGPSGEFLSEITGGRTMNPGHALEGAWFLLNQANLTNDTLLLGKVENLFDWAMERGWDQQYGGILSFVDVLGYPPEAIEHDMKIWWATCEAAICAMMLYEKTRKKEYFDWFQKIDAYAFQAFSDPKHGEWLGYLHRDGTPTLPACKGGLFKGPFHLPRMLMLIERSLCRLEMEHSVDDNSR